MKEIEPISQEGFRDIQQMDQAYRSYLRSRSQMAATRKPVILFDQESQTKFTASSAKDLRMLLYATAAAYRGARSEGLVEAAEYVLMDIREGVEHGKTRT